jgi:hypothetical protein
MGKTKLFLLYHNEDISKYSHPDIIPLKLNQTPYFESEAFRMLEDLPNAENIGFLTPSAKNKIKYFSIENILNLDPDPFFYFCKGPERVEKQAIEYHGKTFLILWRYILDFHRISYSIMNTYYGSYCNLWVAKREFVREYIEFAKKTMNFLDNSSEDIRMLLFSDSRYYEGKLLNTGILNKKFGFNHYPFHPFVMERLISLFATLKKYPYYLISKMPGKTFSILIATVGRPTLQNMLDSLSPQLEPSDCLTIVFDGHSTVPSGFNFSKFMCKVTTYCEPMALGYWGHSIRNKYASLIEKKDFVMHADDDDTYVPDAFGVIRNTCINENTLYIFKFMRMDQKPFPKKHEVKEFNVGTGMGVIPYELNKKGIFLYNRHSGDGVF